MLIFMPICLDFDCLDSSPIASQTNWPVNRSKAHDRMITFKAR